MIALKIIATFLVLILTFYAARDVLSAGYVTRPNLSSMCATVVVASAVLAILWGT
jgi:hypothetical protein